MEMIANCQIFSPGVPLERVRCCDSLMATAQRTAHETFLWNDYQTEIELRRCFVQGFPTNLFAVILK